MREMLRFKINSDYKDLKVLNRSVRTFMGTLNLPVNTIYRVNLILEEIITNVIKYGYDDNHKHGIEVNINITAKHIRIRIIDDGREFNSLKLPEPDTDMSLTDMKIGGLGLILVKNISTNIKYKRHKKKNILRVKINTLEEKKI